MPRPRKTLPRNGLSIIRQAAANCVREKDLAAALGMSFATWQRIREEDPEAREAYQDAKAVEQQHLVGKMAELAYGAPAEYDAEGRLLRAELRPDYRALAFLLGARHEVYAERADTPAAPAGPGLQIVVTGPTTFAQVQEMFPHLRPPAAIEHAAPAQRA